ncbi:AP2 domain transcription factor AP2VIIb-2 [Cardiosporidium cionae]|uniref:AP2 domain transcription factor AP2VIIb-2 n=1 Tax=Cardiosporidium cionae TaxID=476202 RepID=A0ABQ7J822_9APIC|nr:AP2 domain transcription factor AP2VIIb-2 [Cardiosporidium cionae]|eukprot:KAF8820145.1 AP2 domain transcription factor AP2VIIb-2 [Cardiosporidium cionae]
MLLSSWSRNMRGIGLEHNGIGNWSTPSRVFHTLSSIFPFPQLSGKIPSTGVATFPRVFVRCVSSRRLFLPSPTLPSTGGRKSCARLSRSSYPLQITTKENQNTINRAVDVDLESKDITQTSTAQHQRIFQWGIGNRFRSQSENRYRPVHAERPMEATLPDSYYENPHKAIQWENLNEAWEVYWYEYNKLNAKPFPVKKFGLTQAKAEALKFAHQLKREGRLGLQKPSFESGMDGIFWDEALSGWVAVGYEKGRPSTRVYSAEIHGFEESKRLAMKRRERLTVSTPLHVAKLKS